MKIEEFEPGMADLRAVEHAWFVPFDTHFCSHVLEESDPLYKSVTNLVGLPDRRRKGAASNRP